jgi:hypothetical protein
MSKHISETELQKEKLSSAETVKGKVIPVQAVEALRVARG